MSIVFWKIFFAVFQKKLAFILTNFFLDKERFENQFIKYAQIKDEMGRELKEEKILSCVKKLVDILNGI